MSISDKILDAVQLLTKSYVDKAGYDRTIQAQIISCVDATIGKYRCRYQDAIIYAYSNNTETSYPNGSFVYILIPGNDISKDKTILGSVEKLGINYISQAQGDQAYNIIGNNCITSNNIFYLDTNNKNYKYIIYQSGASNNKVDIDMEAIEQYIKQSSSLIAGATFKTSIPRDRQMRGHYGITYNLKFVDNALTEVIRSYTVDEDNMIDNPYRLSYPTRQYQIFDIDGSNFIGVDSIEIFNKDFPKADGNDTQIQLVSGDIEISALELFGANRMTQEQINGVAISFFTPQGTFFTNNSTSTSYKTITAQVKVKGKLASSAQNIPFYWGIENVGVSTNSEYYNKYLGRGWKCLNDKNIIKPATAQEAPIIEWVPGTDTYIVNFISATAKNNKFKVAIVYDGNVISKQINIENLTNVPELTIESSDGTKFYYDFGHPTLTCKVNGEQSNNYTYYWAYESNTGLFEDLPQTTDLNTNYETAVNELQTLQKAIAAGTAFPNAQAEELRRLEESIEAFKFIQRVKGNKIYDVQIRRITNFGTFKCSVYNNDIYYGTCSLTLTNSLQEEGLYSLVINNGAVTFQYNENGVAPNNRSLDIPQQIQALSFTIYDNLGKPLDNDIILNDNNCHIRWAIPIKNTMLIDKQDSESSSGTDVTETYRYYDNVVNLVYDIAQRYNISNSRNQIQLTIDYKGMSLTAETDFAFVKQGEPGTNGTEYVVKLVPNTRMSNPPLWPMITYTGNKYILNYGLNSFNNETEISTAQSYQFFKAQLWHNGDLVWEGFTSNDTALDNTTKPDEVNWTILANKYNATSSDESAFIIDANLKIRYKGDTLGAYFDTPYANIIKCSITWQDKIYYGTIPITTAWVSNDNYRVALKDYTGWRYAIYTTDGMTPQYDNANPFEFIINQKIENVWEDVSLINGNYQVTYTVQSIGNYRNTSATSTVTNANLIEILNSSVYRLNCAKNQWRARPASRYDGVCVNAAITCLYEQGNNVVGKINVPIHFLLNKFGLAHINEWDGNSVQIDDKGGFILSPQMGAGSKNANNEFTGVLMGQVREAGKSSANTGLFGYSSGDRTFFLNSKNGSALFGKQGNGQIIIDPDSNKALLYSNSFWKNYKENGLPTNYNSSNENDQGLLIDLSTPQIRYGSGKFSVDSGGLLHAEGATITGNITASSLDIAGIQIGGTNLLLDTLKDKDSNHDTYDLCDFNFTEHLIAGQSYTVTAKITVSSHRKSIGFYHSGGSISISGWLPKTSDGIYRYTFTATNDMAAPTSGIGYGYCRVYASNNEGNQGSTTITGTGHVDWIKIEQGKNATAWSPAPDDAENKANIIVNAARQVLQASIDANAKAITQKVSSTTYANDKKTLEGKIGSVESTIQQLPNSISGSIKNTYIDPITNRLTEEQKWIRFSSDNYLEIGLNTSNYKTQITNNAFNIKNGNTNIASFSSNGLQTSSITMDDGSELVLPPLMIEPYSNGWLIKRAAT